MATKLIKIQIGTSEYYVQEEVHELIQDLSSKEMAHYVISHLLEVTEECNNDEDLGKYIRNFCKGLEKLVIDVKPKTMA